MSKSGAASTGKLVRNYQKADKKVSSEASYGLVVEKLQSNMTIVPCRGVAKLVKAPDFDSGIRRFDSFHPCQI